ncbi:CPBP family intramembrane glutamic endopeptidase [Streptomyces sp. NPDC015032]|uniref:CPBP family intramembrane glutamic endopeptidase n=1 Tax=Streptomyces sp. NPDC015032 TaxID=3364937 RepID=UPI0036FB135A
MRFVWQLLAVVAVSFIGGQAVIAAEGNWLLRLVLGLLAAALALLVYGWVVRRTERRPSTEVGREGAGKAFGRGTLLGAVLFSMVITNLAASGYYKVDGLDSVTGALGLVGFMAVAAVTEELLYRGVLLRIIEQRIGTWLALVATSLLFGLSHLLNEHATLWGAIAIAVEAGGMLGGAYIATRTLWLPIGLHFGWNFAESGIFGTEVSGNGTEHGLLGSVTSGPRLLTGGEFGPEASVYSVLFGVLTTAAFMWLAHRRGNLVPRRRADRSGAVATLAR